MKNLSPAVSATHAPVALNNRFTTATTRSKPVSMPAQLAKRTSFNQVKQPSADAIQQAIAALIASDRLCFDNMCILECWQYFIESKMMKIQTDYMQKWMTEKVTFVLDYFNISQVGALAKHDLVRGLITISLKNAFALYNENSKDITRLSVTMLDTYVYGMASDEVTSHDLAKQLFGKFEQSPAMAAGTAFHSLLEFFDKPQPAASKYRFILPDDLNGTLELGLIREMKYTWDILPDVVLVGKIDAETSSKVIDHKLTARFDQDRYMDAMQWRAYLAMRKKAHFTYQVFEHSGIPEQPDEHGIYKIMIKEYHRLDQYAYAGMAEEVREVACDLAKFALEWKPIIQHETAQA